MLHPALGFSAEKNNDLLDGIQRKAIRMIREMERLYYEERLRKMGLISLGER